MYTTVPTSAFSRLDTAVGGNIKADQFQQWVQKCSSQGRRITSTSATGNDIDARLLELLSKSPVPNQLSIPCLYIRTIKISNGGKISCSLSWANYAQLSRIELGMLPKGQLCSICVLRMTIYRIGLLKLDQLRETNMTLPTCYESLEPRLGHY